MTGKVAKSAVKWLENNNFSNTETVSWLERLSQYMDGNSVMFLLNFIENNYLSGIKRNKNFEDYLINLFEDFVFFQQFDIVKNLKSFLIVLQKKQVLENKKKNDPKNFYYFCEASREYYDYNIIYNRAIRVFGRNYVENNLCKYLKMKVDIDFLSISNQIVKEIEIYAKDSIGSNLLLSENSFFEKNMVDANGIEWIFSVPKSIGEVERESTVMHNCLGCKTRLTQLIRHEIFVIFMRPASDKETPFIDIILNEDYQKMWWILKDHKEAVEYYPIIEKYLKTIFPEKKALL